MQTTGLDRASGPLQCRGHLVEPIDRAFLGADADALDQTLPKGAAAQCRRVGKLPLLEPAVGIQQLGAFGAQRGDLRPQRRRLAVSGATQLDGHITGAVVAECAAASGPALPERRSDPPGQFGAADVGDVVDLLIRPAALDDQLGGYPAVVFHRPQGAVDLLVCGAPEVPDPT